VASIKIGLPSDISLPYFAYGALKCEEIAWPQRGNNQVNRYRCLPPLRNVSGST